MTRRYRRDVELAKAMGFNGVRKHQKIEDPALSVLGGRLGLLVWEEMPSAYRFTQDVHRAADARVGGRRCARDVSHPCIIAWVPFNESWGVPDLPDSPAQRHYVQALYHLTKTLDPTRPVIGNDGWESVATDIIGIHDYDDDPARIAQRYVHRRDSAAVQTGAAGRTAAAAGGAGAREQPIMLTRVRRHRVFARRGGHLGLLARRDATDEFAKRYLNAARRRCARCRCWPASATRSSPTLTRRPTGLLYADRTPKFPIEHIALATRGPRHQARFPNGMGVARAADEPPAAAVHDSERGPSDGA